MATPDLKIEPKRLITYLNVAMASNKRTMATAQQKYGDSHAIVDALREEQAELTNAISILAKAGTLAK